MVYLWRILHYKKTTFKEENNLSKLGDILNNPESADTDTSGNIDLKESSSLAIALALNNMGLGIGASITGLNVVFTSILTFL